MSSGSSSLRRGAAARIGVVLLAASVEVEPRAAAGAVAVALEPYLEAQTGAGLVPGGYSLAFEGALGHVLAFRVRAERSVEVECQVTAPNGHTRLLHRTVSGGAEPRDVRFSLGPLLGHGPYVYRPTRFHPGEYLVRAAGRDAETGQELFAATFRLPPQEWIWADLSRLLYIDDAEAAVDMKLVTGALAASLPVVVDLVEPLGGKVLAAPRRVALGTAETQVRFDLRALGPGNYRVRIRPEIDGRVWPDGIERTLQLFRNGPAPRVSGSAAIGRGPQLFVDDYLVGESRDLERVFQPGKKVVDRPVLEADRPYEGHSVIFREAPERDPATGRYRGTYTHVNYSSLLYEMLAESPDLVSWTKPSLGKVEVDGSTQNNVVRVRDEKRVETLADNFAGVWDYAARGNPNLRGARFWQQGRPMTDDALHLRRGFYLTVRDAGGKSYVTSGDPILFLREGGTETMTASGDTVAPLGYDARRGEFVVYTSPGPPNVGRWVRYDNSTKARTIARHSTRDGINWEARYIWVAPAREPTLHNYGFRVRQVGDAYLGFFPRYNVKTQKMDLQLWTSRDGIHWEEPGGKAAWLANGAPGTFDWGITYMPVGWFEEGERTRILFHGANGLHFHAWIREKLSGLYGGMRQRGAEALLTDAAFVDRPYVAAPTTKGPGWSLVGSGWSWRRGVATRVEEARRQFWADLTASTGETPETFIERSRTFKIAVGVAEFRTNGFVARRAGPSDGVLTTHPLDFEGSRLTVNAAAGSGAVAVEVLDAAGAALPGFGRADCRLGAFDAVEHPVRWRGGADLGGVKRPVRLRFHLRNADLYGFRIR